MNNKFDVIIVGAGISGISAACILAKNGANTIVLERGKFPGSKNIIGGTLFTNILNKIIPEFWKEAPLERYLNARKFSLLSADTELAFSYKTYKYKEAPFNNSYTILRSKFDPWFSKKAEKYGATVLSEVVADELITENNKVIGVKTKHQGESIFADCTILAEGANTVLAEKYGFKKKPNPGQMVIGVKEIVSLPKETIENRFQLNGAEGVPEGASVEYFGDAVKGMVGKGFIYTNRDSISIGAGATLSDIAKYKTNPNDLLEYFKNHPCVSKLISGGETNEYSSHLIPETNYKELPRMVANGLLLVGDCAGLVNTSYFHEGTNLAMASGLMAAETIIDAKNKGDFSVSVLSNYEKKLKSSFVLKDLNKFKNFNKFLKNHPELMNKYPKIFSELITDYFNISEEPKKAAELKILWKLIIKIGVIKPLKTFFGLLRAMGWLP